MKNFSGLVILALILIIGGCNSRPTTGVPTEFAKACSPENEKKYLEVSGFLDDKGGVFCSNRGGRMECSFNLRETPTGEKKLSAYIETGTSANTAEQLPKGYSREDLKIRDNAGNIINLADKVKVTGELNTTGDPNVCFINVTKIEK
ncbi:MAG TPA: hypothetical protein VF721_24385 [Pyrinomonadaceae bacterium]|jgi:hypothetical protein